MTHSYASTQIPMPAEVADRMKAFAKTIAPDDLAEDGIESDPHVTVKYGLHSDSPKDAQDALKDEMPVRFRMSGLRVFPATAERKNDVLVSNIQSPDLHRLHQIIGSATPHIDTHPDYKPHATIAYLKPGKGEEYARRSDMDGIEGTADTVVHSARDDTKTNIKLEGKVRHPQPMVLSLSTDPAKPALVLGQGFPKEVNGQPAHYFRKEIARVGHYVHRSQRADNGKPLEFDITADRADRWCKNFRQRRDAGIKPFLPNRHIDDSGEYIRSENDARANNGYAVDLERDGDSLYATLQLIGDKALAVAAANDVSIFVEPDAVDAKGNEYDECIKHIALTPDPIIPHLGPFTRIAASADQQPRDVPVFVLAAQQRSPDMDKQTIVNLRAKFGWGNDIPDEQIGAKAAEKALALSGEVSTLTAERDTLKQTVTAKEQQVLSLSADLPRKPDEITMAMYADNVAAKRQAAIASGALTEAEAKTFDGIISDAKGLTPLALSACGEDRKPLAFKLWDAIGKLSGDGVRTGLVQRTGVVPAERLAASGDTAAQKAKDDADEDDLRRRNNLPPRKVA